MENVNLMGLITPAIAISVIAFLSHFFGKVINDQAPFSDDDKWASEFRGVLFTLDISVGILGTYLAVRYPWGIGHWWFYIIAIVFVSIIIVALQLNNTYLSSKFFNINKNKIKTVEKKTDGFITMFANISKYISVGFVSIILFYFGTLVYLSNNVYLIIFYFPILLFAFINLALNFSTKKSLKDKIVPVDIYFKDSNNETLKGIVIIKYNNDNIKVRLDNKIIIINKSEVLKIEMVIPEENL
jgi:MFS family permease